MLKCVEMAWVTRHPDDTGRLCNVSNKDDGNGVPQLALSPSPFIIVPILTGCQPY